MAAILETRHDAVVRRNEVSVVPRLEEFDHNGIGVDVVRQHNVVVSTEGADGEAAHVICVELADGITDDVEFLGFYGRKFTGDVGKSFLVGRSGLGGARTLSILCHVSFQGIDQDRTVSRLVCIREAWPGGKIASFDGR